MAEEHVSVKDKIDHLLDETRVVLPGTQALLGFQLNAFFSSSFEKISVVLKDLHLLSLIFIAIGVILLMTPVAFHQIVEKGNVTERFDVFTRRILVTTLVMLGLGLALDIYVVVELTTKSHELALVTAIVTAAFAYFLWFGYTIFQRERVH